MISKSLISVIIVTWNVEEIISRCLNSIINTKYPSLEIIVIDNASTDGTKDILESFPNIHKIINNKNFGFPKAVNQGLRTAKGDYILCLNPDCLLPPDFFTKCLSRLQTNIEIGLIGPQLLNADSTPQGSVFRFPTIKNAILEFWLGYDGLTQKYIPSFTKPVYVEVLSGACWFFPSCILEKIGYLTEQVHMYYEDFDFCRRIVKSGMKILYDPNIKVIHYHGLSSKKTPLAKKYLKDSSIWYNGRVKHYLLFIITLFGQKFSSLTKR